MKQGLDSLILSVWCLDCLMHLTGISFYAPEDFLLQFFGGGGVFCAFRTKFAFFFFYACYPKSWFLSAVLFSCSSRWHLLFTLSLSLFNWSIFFTFSSSSHSLPSAWVPLLMRLSTELVYLSFWIWKWFTPGISVSLLHSSVLSCATFLTSFHCVLGQQLLSVWVAFTNLDALCFLSTHVFDSFNHSFDFSGISPNSFSLDTISVGFIKWLKELRYLVFMCGFCYSSGTYTTAVSIFAWFTLLLMIRSQLTYLM